MNLLNKFLFVAFLLSFAFLTESISQTFTEMKHPVAPGQRSATASVGLNGLNKNQVKVSIIYGTDSLAVARAFDMRLRDPKKYFQGNATLGTISGGRVDAEVIFPHKDNAPTNKGKVFNSGTKVFYAWARTNTPAGATEELTLNSPVQSFVMPRPLTIAYMGDSYASGEGAPDGNFSLTPPRAARWDLGIKQHRSRNSGGELALSKLINEKKELEIDYINATCSGAEIIDFYHRNQPDDNGQVKNVKQIKQIEDWMNSNNYNELDIVLMNGGGNDVGFADIITEGVIAPFWNGIASNNELKRKVNEVLDLDLPNRYDELNDVLKSNYGDVKILYFNAPNLLEDKNGNLCRPNMGSDGFPCWTLPETNISDADWLYVKNTIFRKLISAMSAAASRNNWTYIDITSRSNRKGLCNCQSPKYFNTVLESVAIQGDQFGGFHPSKEGFKQIYEIPLFNSLVTSTENVQKEFIQDAKRRAIDLAKAKAIATQRFKANEPKRINSRNDNLRKDLLQFVDEKNITLSKQMTDTLRKLNPDIKLIQIDENKLRNLQNLKKIK